MVESKARGCLELSTRHLVAAFLLLLGPILPFSFLVSGDLDRCDNQHRSQQNLEDSGWGDGHGERSKSRPK